MPHRKNETGDRFSMTTRLSRNGHPKHLAWSLAALGVGLAAGILLHGSSGPGVGRLAEVIATAGRLWVGALRLIVLPLVVTQTFLAAARTLREGSIGALGARALLVFLGMLVLAGLFAIAVTPLLLQLHPVAPETAASLRAGAPVPASVPEKSRQGGPSVGAWLESLLPHNIVQAAAGGELLPVLLFTVFFGLAVARLAPPRRDPLVGVFQGLADATMVLIEWILVVAPLGIFALTFELAFRAGVTLAGLMAAFVVLLSGLLLLFTGLLYPLTGILARIPVARFARAVLPAQLVAVSTRSSLASLPAMVESARDDLVLPASATGFVLPLSVSVFKLNQPISGIVKLLFLGHAFHVPLSLTQVAAFLASVLILSFSSVGIPGGSSAFRNLPAYLAAGMPIEGVIFLEAADAIPDIFKTLTNVTGDLSAASILARPGAQTAE
jgi:proton glutamate symport protein